jgi:hypothetical protein
LDELVRDRPLPVMTNYDRLLSQIQHHHERATAMIAV